MALRSRIFTCFFQRITALQVSVSIALCLIFARCDSPKPSSEKRTAAPSDTVQWSPLELQHAQGFGLRYFSNYKLLSLFQPTDTLRYLLLPHHSPPPSGVDYDQLIRIPVERVIVQSTTHLALARFLDARDVIVGIDQAAYVYDSAFAQRVSDGSIQEVGSGTALNPERVIALQPDLLLISRMPGSSLDPYQKFMDLGIPVLPNAEWMEPSPLGKTEWVKLMAALLNREELAVARFTEVEQAYDSLTHLVQQPPLQPSVIVGSPFQGTWYVPGGNSYRSTLLQHAQARWPWSQDSSAVSFPVDFERMYAYGLTADYWIDPGQVRTKAELLSIDARFADFKAFQQGKIYNSNRRLNANGSGNDYYESGAIYPQRVLADLIKILHPEVLPDHALYYYQPLR
ncbi:MAG: ABC transporter substrate-binding protein [Cyclobacteriaceae bacterium]